jgi:hypothetical protein
MEDNRSHNDDLDLELQEMFEQDYLNKRIKKSNHRKLAMILTVGSLGLFSPATVPYLAYSYYKDHKCGQKNKSSPLLASNEQEDLYAMEFKR